MIADHPFSGVGFDKIGVEYQKYWQPFNEGHRYLSAVSLPLTFFAGCGAGVFALYGLGTLLAVRFSFLLIKREGNLFFAWAFSSFLCFSTANLFATITDRIIVCPLLGMAAIVLYFSAARFRARELFRCWRRHALQ
jgi:hypothetical protein